MNDSELVYIVIGSTQERYVIRKPKPAPAPIVESGHTAELVEHPG